MRAHIFGAGRAQSRFSPFGPNNLFERDVTGLALASDQTPARKVANQLNYNNESYAHWYGYTGPAWTQGEVTKFNIANFAPTLWIVPAGHPKQKMTFVNASGEPEPGGASHNLQSFCESVPVPDITKIPGGSIPAEGTDAHVCIICFDTNEMWEFWRFAGTPGAYTFRYGGYVPNLNQWNGIFPNNWGARATSLALIGGLITLQDMVEVLQGRGINHALAMLVACTDAAGPIAPATRQDRQTTVVETHEGKPNPAYPNVDGIAESSWFRFPTASAPSEYGIMQPLEVAIYEAVREYGIFLCDGDTNRIPIESPLSTGSPYAYHKVYPLAGAPATNLAPGGGSFSYAQSWKDSKLPGFTEKLYGASGAVLSKQPWQNLELLAPRSE